MKGKACILLILFAVFVFAYSFGFHSSLRADEKRPEPCDVIGDLNNCCYNEDTQMWGVCVLRPGDLDVSCRCDCLFVNTPSCGGIKHCQYEVCAGGGIE